MNMKDELKKSWSNNKTTKAKTWLALGMLAGAIITVSVEEVRDFVSDAMDKVKNYLPSKTV